MALTRARRYSPERPYWEAVQLIKKLMLVIASSTFFTAAPQQAAIGFGVNLIYLAFFEVKRPMPYRPSTSVWFKGQNFFHLAERSSALTSLAGSLLAVLGATNRSLVDVLGTAFAIMNIAYVATVMYAFAKSSNSGHKITPTMSGVGAIERLTSEWCVLNTYTAPSPSSNSTSLSVAGKAKSSSSKKQKA